MMFKDWSNLSNRWFYSIGVLIVLGLIGGALYLQYGLREDPCPLCMIQRVIFIAIGAIFFIAAIHNAGRIGRWVYSTLIALTALGGVGVASRHIWLQHLPKDQVPACGPGLDFMLKNFPMAEVWQELMHGSGECATKGWTFLSLGLPEWALIWYVVLGLLAIFIAVKRQPIQ
jgi:disulfide bond formation protein DsbB